ncbi:hypothetical protein BDV95DRAFT_348410 [Massariosphaeria phaeospora]|uniref:Adenosine deaminase domain-containing protein n=1 Tax=Massariosphaeria phaeospora TaxID=100035 RepID=A0A7C8MS05_9PLEO|nr:hypothetical protein BDV95DRAFT_348410 [Massariosphaeria phaeospora]
MPTDTDPKTPSDSQKPRQGWLAKCGIIIPTISVRDRHASEGDPNRPVMLSANSKDKKRKRTSSPSTSSFTTRTTIRVADSRAIPRTMSDQDPKKTFSENLKEGTFYSSYTKIRDGLVEDERNTSWDHNVKASASASERQAAMIMSQLREFERAKLFGSTASEDLPKPHTLDMGGQFLTNQKRIEEQSRVYRIAQEVPKGALLHLHFNAELHPERLLEYARTKGNLYIRSTQPLQSAEDLELTEVVFNVMDPSKVDENVNIFDENYPGKKVNYKPKDEAYKRVWMPWEEFKGKFVGKFRGQYVQTEDEKKTKVSLEPAENWVKQKMVLSEKEAYDPTQTVNGVWARFNQATRCFKGLLNYEEAFDWYIGQAIQRMIEEKIMYAELRPMLLDPSIPGSSGKESDALSHADQMRRIQAGVDAKKAELVDSGQGHLFPFGLKIIYCTPRSISKKMMRDELENCLALKDQFPNLICGFDLVGAEDRENHIGYYSEELVAFQETCKQNNLEIPFLFHAGETLLDTGGSNKPENSNLFDAVALNSKRIGHGFSLLKHPGLVKKFQKTDTNPGICVELCPISNELLHLCRNIKEHPYPELLAAGIPCTVNSDNPSLFSNSMSHEFYQIMVGSPTISLHSWKQLGLWSLEYSCLSPKEKEEATTIYLKQWEKFCEKVVDNYTPLFKKTSNGVGYLQLDWDEAEKEYGIESK